MLAKLSHPNASQWYKYVEKVQQLINKYPSRSTKQSPFKILTGGDMRVKTDLALNDILENEVVSDLTIGGISCVKKIKETYRKVKKKIRSH